MVKTNNNNKDSTVFGGFFGGARGISGSNMFESSTLRQLGLNSGENNKPLLR